MQGQTTISWPEGHFIATMIPLQTVHLAIARRPHAREMAPLGSTAALQNFTDREGISERLKNDCKTTANKMGYGKRWHRDRQTLGRAQQLRNQRRHLRTQAHMIPRAGSHPCRDAQGAPCITARGKTAPPTKTHKHPETSTDEAASAAAKEQEQRVIHAASSRVSCRSDRAFSDCTVRHLWASPLAVSASTTSPSYAQTPRETGARRKTEALQAWSACQTHPQTCLKHHTQLRHPSTLDTGSSVD